MVIAGIQNDESYSRNTFIYNSVHKEWTEGTPLKQGRNTPGCGRIISGKSPNLKKKLMKVCNFVIPLGCVIWQFLVVKRYSYR